MDNYTVYILLCADDSLYIGVTNDIVRRLDEHQSGLHSTAYTYKRRPVTLVFEELFHDINQAIEFEKQIKGWRREKKEALIRRDWDALPELSQNYIKRFKK